MSGRLRILKLAFITVSIRVFVQLLRYRLDNRDEKYFSLTSGFRANGKSPRRGERTVRGLRLRYSLSQL